MLQGSCVLGSLWQAMGHWRPAACYPLQRIHQLCVCRVYQASIARRAPPTRWVSRLAAALVYTPVVLGFAATSAGRHCKRCHRHEH